MLQVGRKQGDRRYSRYPAAIVAGEIFSTGFLVRGNELRQLLARKSRDERGWEERHTGSRLPTYT